MSFMDMDGEVNRLGEERLLDFLREQALATDLGQWPVADAVTCCGDDGDFEIDLQNRPWAFTRRSRVSWA